MPAHQISEKHYYLSGDIVFAKLKGYPWWPAKIEDESNVPKPVLEAKRKKKSATDAYVVFFFGSLDYAFFSEKMLRPFNRETVLQDLKAVKFKNKDLVEALYQALDPDGLDFLQQQQDHDNNDDTTEQLNRKLTKSTTTSSSRSIKQKNIATTEKNTPKLTKKRTLESGNHSRTHYGNDRSTKRQKSSPVDTLIPATTKSHKPRSLLHKSKYIQVAARKSPEYERIFKRIYGNRHKLQKLIYNKKPGQVPASDHPKISDILKDIEQYDMTKELLKDTKIGKVVEIGCKYVFENDDPFRLQKRCMDIMKNWKANLLNQNITPTDLDTSSTTPLAPNKDATFYNESSSAIYDNDSRCGTTNNDNLLATPTSPEAGKIIPTKKYNIDDDNTTTENNKLQKEKHHNNSNTEKTTKIELTTENDSLGNVLCNRDPSSTASPTTMTDNLIPLPQAFNMEKKDSYRQHRPYYQVSSQD